jgi:ubiquinone/menaquinone biosynthesis C-methylase UbiE/uncharacterized protein YbaR (Trm112 family)
MKPETASLLCNPTTHEPLRLVSRESPGGATGELLVGAESGKSFPIRDGIPMFVDYAEVTGLNKQYQGVYDRMATIYDLGSRARRFLIGGWPRKTILTDLRIADATKVLEVSIGTGFNVSLLPRKAEYFGLDISWGMLKRCQMYMKKLRMDVELFFGNAEYLPFKDRTFDVVFHIGGINFFNDKARAIREMIRVAKPGTRILIGDETARLEGFYSRLPLVGEGFKGKAELMRPPVEMVPKEMQDVQVKYFYGSFYVLTFTKPA